MVMITEDALSHEMQFCRLEIQGVDNHFRCIQNEVNTGVVEEPAETLIHQRIGRFLPRALSSEDGHQCTREKSVFKKSTRS